MDWSFYLDCVFCFYFSVARSSMLVLVQFCNVSSMILWMQVSFFLGIVPVFAAWLYSEYLECRKNWSATKQ